MHRIVIPLVSLATGIIGLFLGIMLGSLLGKIGSLQILRFSLKIPFILVRSPKELKSKWRMFWELRNLRNIECLKRQKKIEELAEEINGRKKEIRKIKTQIRRIKWEFCEPR